MSLRSVLSICALSLLVLARAHAQTPQSTFQAEVNLIEVDAIVTDEQGNAVVGLTIDDFELFDDGQPQKIAAFSYVDIPLEIPPEFPGVDRPVPVDVRSNKEPVSGRMYVIVLDDMNIDSIRTSVVRQHAREFVESYFGAGDIAAVTYTSGRADASQDFTSDAQLLLASIDKFIGRGVRSAAMEAAAKFYEDRLTLELDAPPGAKPGEHSSGCRRHAGRPDAHARHKRQADRRSHRLRSRASASSRFSTRCARLPRRSCRYAAAAKPL